MNLQLKSDAVLKNLYKRRGVKPGLKRLERLLELFGIKKIPFKIVHIAGTNGKGSTAYLCNKILANCGYRTGLFMSPHLISVTERISINAKPIRKKILADYVKRILKKIENDSVASEATFFEIITFAAILYFIDEKVNWAVFEVGMGGRLDATNILKGDICVITSISKDHCSFLGKKISQIANEKFAIIKKGSIVVNMNGKRLLERVDKKILKRARDIFSYSCDFFAKKVGKTIYYTDRKDCIKLNFTLVNPSTFFKKNAACSIFAAWQAVKNEISEKEFIKKAVLSAENFDLKGRFHIVRKNPYLVFDVCHNYSAVKEVVKSAKVLSSSKWIVAFGALRDKNVKKMVSLLNTLADKIIFVNPESDRAFDFNIFIEQSKEIRYRYLKTNSFENIFEIWKKKYAHCNLLVCGSFYVVGPALKAYEKLKN